MLRALPLEDRCQLLNKPHCRIRKFFRKWWTAFVLASRGTRVEQGVLCWDDARVLAVFTLGTPRIFVPLLANFFVRSCRCVLPSPCTVITSGFSLSHRRSVRSQSFSFLSVLAPLATFGMPVLGRYTDFTVQHRPEVKANAMFECIRAVILIHYWTGHVVRWLSARTRL